MAANFEIIAAVPTESFDGAGRPAPVMRVDALSKPHDVSISVTVPKVEGWKENALAQLAAEAAEVESLFGA